MSPELAAEVLTRLPEPTPGKSQLVAVSGAPGLGKSTSCEWFASTVRTALGPSRHLKLDHFLYDRSWRHERGLFGTQKSSFRWSELTRVIQAVHAGQATSYRWFDQHTGLVSDELLQLPAGNALLWVDGALALHAELRPYVSLSVFFDGSKDWCREARCAANYGDRGYSRESAEAMMDTHWRAFVQDVAPLRTAADLVVWCEPGHLRSVYPSSSAPARPASDDSLD